MSNWTKTSESPGGGTMLEVRNLSKRFSRDAPPALREVSFSVGRGQICGLLGHNGAGKSTVLGAVLGLVYPDQGEVFIGGVSVQAERVAAMRKTGAIFEAPSFYNYLSGWKNLQVLTSFSPGVTRAALEEAVVWAGLKDRIHHKVGTYSHGMRQRLGLAQALVPRPQFLLLDEPTDGLDPEGIVEFRHRLLELRDRLHLTVLLSSHLLTEAAQVCDQIVILQAGKKVYDGEARGISSARQIYRIEAGNATEKEIAAAAAGFGSMLLPGGGISFPAELKASDLLAFLVTEKRIAVSHFSPETDSLEKLYLSLSKAETSKRL